MIKKQLCILLNHLFLTRKKIRKNITLIGQAEIIIIQSNFEVFKNFDIKQSRIPSQIIFVVVTNQNEAIKNFKMILDQSKTMFMKFPNQSILLSFSKISKIYI